MCKDHEQIKKYLTIAKGQLEGIIKMVDEDRYCMDISDQLMATRGLLKKTNNLILKNHILSKSSFAISAATASLYSYLEGFGESSR